MAATFARPLSTCKTYRKQNRQYVIQPNAAHRQIELHTALNSTCRRHTHHVQTARSVFVCLGIPRFSEGKKLVARISKSEPLILKSEPIIFYLLPGRFFNVLFMFHFFPSENVCKGSVRRRNAPLSGKTAIFRRFMLAVHQKSPKFAHNSKRVQTAGLAVHH